MNKLETLRLIKRVLAEGNIDDRIDEAELEQRILDLLDCTNLGASIEYVAAVLGRTNRCIVSAVELSEQLVLLGASVYKAGGE